MFLKRSDFIQALREATGLSKATCEAKAATVPLTPDGKRQKLNDWHLHRLIRELNEPVEHTVKGPSEKQMARLQA